MTTLPAEHDLVEALRPVRPDAAAFRRAFERKLAERAASAERSSAWRNAAGLFPASILAPEPTAVAVSKKVGASTVAGVVALPVASLAMLVLAFVSASRAALRVRPGVEDRRIADEALRAWWRERSVYALASLAIVVALALWQPIEAVVGVLVLSMLAVGQIVTRLSLEGAATRRSVGTFGAAFLGGVLALALALDPLANRLGGELVAPFWAPLVVLVGVFACDVAARWRRAWPTWKKLANAGMPVALLVALATFLGDAMRPASDARARAFVEAFDRPLDDTVHWMRAAEVVAGLRAEGVAPDLAVPRRALADASDAFELDTTAPLVASVEAAARMDVLPDAVWREVLDDPATARVLADDAAVLHTRGFVLAVRALARRGLDEVERERVGRRLRAAWPGPAQDLALERMDELVDLMALVGRPLTEEEVDARRPEVHAALANAWRAPSRESGGAFAGTSELRDRATVAAPLLVASTSAGVRLMARFGAPAAIELEPLARFLRRAASPGIVEVLAPASIDLLTIQDDRFVAALALDRLLEAFGERIERPTIASAIAGERVLIGAALLTLLCLAVSIRAGARAPAKA